MIDRQHARTRAWQPRVSLALFLTLNTPYIQCHRSDKVFHDIPPRACRHTNLCYRPRSIARWTLRRSAVCANLSPFWSRFTLSSGGAPPQMVYRNREKHREGLTSQKIRGAGPVPDYSPPIDYRREKSNKFNSKTRQNAHVVVVYLTLTDPLRTQLCSQDRRSQNKTNRERTQSEKQTEWSGP